MSGLGLPELFIKTSVVAFANHSLGVSVPYFLYTTVLLGLGSLSIWFPVRCWPLEELAQA